jgi:hypothetical protein
MANEEQNTSTSETQTTPQEVTRPVTQMPETPKQKPWLVIGLTVLVLILLGTTGFFAYRNYQLKQQITQTQPAPLPELIEQPEIPSPTPTTDVTINWQSYNNDEYKFSFKYPSNYYLSDEFLKIHPEDVNSLLGITIIKEENKEVGQPPTISLNIVQTEKSSKEFLDYDHQRELTSWEGFEEERGFAVDKPYIISEDDVQNNGVIALKVERQRMPTAPHSKETLYLIKKDNLLYILSVNYGTYNPDTEEDGTDEKNTLDLIFSTFKFLQ